MMSQNKGELSGVSETIEKTSGHTPIHEQLNPYLDAGWQIMDQWVVGHGDPSERRETLHVLLGWAHSAPAQHPVQK